MREKVLLELQALMNGGDELITHTSFGTRKPAQWPDVQRKYYQFLTRALNLVGRACDKSSDHYRELSRVAGITGGNSSANFTRVLGIVEAAHHDVESGLLFDMRSLISAELLGDFLQQADALLDKGYHVPAASLAGAVLEDVLRKLCLRNRIEVGDKTTIGALNSALGREQVYNLLTQKEITAKADVRNNADHGHSEQFTKADVQAMVKWVRTFAEQHLSLAHESLANG